MIFLAPVENLLPNTDKCSLLMKTLPAAAHVVSESHAFYDCGY